MPAHNSAATLDEAIGSVLAQTFEDLELLVIENGSSDDTLGLARRWSARDPRVYVTTLELGDVALARNAGIAEARGDYVTFLDSDDVYLPGYLAFLDSAVREHPGRTMYAVGGVSVAPDGARSPLSPSMPKDRPRELTLSDVAWMTLFPNQVAYPADELRRAGRVSPLLHRGLRPVAPHVRGRRHGDLPARGVQRASHLPLEPQSRPRVLRALRRLGARVSARRAHLRHRRARTGRPWSVARRFWSGGASGSPRVPIWRSVCAAGEYARARRDYLHAAAAYRSRARFVAGLAVMTVSPRLFARLMLRREGAVGRRRRRKSGVARGRMFGYPCRIPAGNRGVSFRGARAGKVRAG